MRAIGSLLGRAPGPGSGRRCHPRWGDGAAGETVRVGIGVAWRWSVAYAVLCPTSGSWLNLVEVWFRIIDRQATIHGTFNSVRELSAMIRTFINRLEPLHEPVQ